MSSEESSREALADAYAQFFASSLGMSASTGRIFGAILLSPVPLSQAQLRSTLSLSDGSISEGVGLLAALGFVERSGDPRARPAFFQVRSDGWADPAHDMLENLKATHALVHATRRHLEEHALDGPSFAWVAKAAAMYDSLLADMPAVVQRALDAAERPPAKRGKRPPRVKNSG